MQINTHALTSGLPQHTSSPPPPSPPPVAHTDSMPAHNDLQGIDLGMSELDLLDFLTSPDFPPAKHGLKRRDADLDPLMLAAVYSSGPQVTRNHYAHDFFPAVGDPRAEGAYDWTKWQAETSKSLGQRRPRLKYVSRQEPRSQRLKKQGVKAEKPVSEAVSELKATHRTGSLTLL